MSRYTFLQLSTINAPFMQAIERATLRVVNSGYYIGGPEVEAFEKNLAQACEAPNAQVIGVSNGLDALRLIFRAYKELGVLNDGDEVIVPANTYIASILAITDNNLTPILVEPRRDTMNLDTALIEQHITPRTRAILVVHLYGRIVWDNTLMDVAKRHNLKIIEDNAQAIGAVSPIQGFHNSQRSGTLGDAAAFSFYPTKNIGALGDAGAVLTHDDKLADAIRALRNYGSDRRYHNLYAGWNCRLDPLQAAIIRVKLPSMDTENDYRRHLASIYDSLITNELITKPLWDRSRQSVWHQYVIRTPNRDALRKYLLENGVETDILYPTPPHLQPCYSTTLNSERKLNLPITEEIASTCLSLPITRCTTVDDAKDIATFLNNFSF
jgi:dTDP-4-amino-4,6-dideoxygalactose transaminase